MNFDVSGLYFYGLEQSLKNNSFGLRDFFSNYCIPKSYIDWNTIMFSILIKKMAQMIFDFIFIFIKKNKKYLLFKNESDIWKLNAGMRSGHGHFILPVKFVVPGHCPGKFRAFGLARAFQLFSLFCPKFMPVIYISGKARC